MNSLIFFQFYALLRKEIWEHRTLLIGTPVLVAGVIFVINFLIAGQLGEEEVRALLGFIETWFDGLAPTETAPIITLLASPFVTAFYFAAVIYLANGLYHDRRDMSILFWQSMPVSNLQTVLAKIVTVMVVGPGFVVITMAIFYTFDAVGLWYLGVKFDIGFEGLDSLYAASMINLLVMYLFIATSVLWLMPLVGWLLLFSAFARKAPLLWAIGIYFLLGFVEGFIFNTQFLANWAQTRFDPDNFIIAEFGGIYDRLFSYDMLIGLVVGAVLLTGAVYMRRFID